MISIDESEQLTINFALLKTEEKLKEDIDAAFSGEMTDFDLDGEVDQIFTSDPTSPRKRAGSWTSFNHYQPSDESRNESPSKIFSIYSHAQ